jgi:UMF1 family MFS transporter
LYTKDRPWFTSSSSTLVSLRPAALVCFGNLDIVNVAMNLYMQGIDPRLDFSDPGLKEFIRLSIPIMLAIPENTAVDPDSGKGILDSYRKVFHKVNELRKNSRETFYFLLSSAVFRDGLAGVFTFGGILAGKVFGLGDTEVILFAIAGNLVAGIGVFVAGFLDDRFSSKTVITWSLTGLVITGSALFVLHEGGPTVFWVGGLLLTLFVGPAQASGRSLIGRLAPVGTEGELYGLYATTGRAISFLTPMFFALFVGWGGADYWGILGIVLVLGAGLLLMLPLRPKFVR